MLLRQANSVLQTLSYLNFVALATSVGNVHPIANIWRIVEKYATAEIVLRSVKAVNNSVTTHSIDHDFL